MKKDNIYPVSEIDVGYEEISMMKDLHRDLGDRMFFCCVKGGEDGKRLRAIEYSKNGRHEMDKRYSGDRILPPAAIGDQTSQYLRGVRNFLVDKGLLEKERELSHISSSSYDKKFSEFTEAFFPGSDANLVLLKTEDDLEGSKGEIGDALTPQGQATAPALMSRGYSTVLKSAIQPMAYGNGFAQFYVQDKGEMTAYYFVVSYVSLERFGNNNKIFNCFVDNDGNVQSSDQMGLVTKFMKNPETNKNINLMEAFMNIKADREILAKFLERYIRGEANLEELLNSYEIPQLCKPSVVSLTKLFIGDDGKKKLHREIVTHPALMMQEVVHKKERKMFDGQIDRSQLDAKLRETYVDMQHFEVIMLGQNLVCCSIDHEPRSLGVIKKRLEGVKFRSEQAGAFQAQMVLSLKEALWADYAGEDKGVMVVDCLHLDRDKVSCLENSSYSVFTNPKASYSMHNDEPVSMFSHWFFSPPVTKYSSPLTGDKAISQLINYHNKTVTDAEPLPSTGEDRDMVAAIFKSLLQHKQSQNRYEDDYVLLDEEAFELPKAFRLDLDAVAGAFLEQKDEECAQPIESISFVDKDVENSSTGTLLEQKDEEPVQPSESISFDDNDVENIGGTVKITYKKANGETVDKSFTDHKPTMFGFMGM